MRSRSDRKSLSPSAAEPVSRTALGAVVATYTPAMRRASPRKCCAASVTEASSLKLEHLRAAHHQEQREAGADGPATDQHGRRAEALRDDAADQVAERHHAERRQRQDAENPPSDVIGRKSLDLRLVERA